MKHGIIRGFEGTWDSGIATLSLEHDGVTERVLCDNGPTVRCLRDLFGDEVISDGHTVNVKALLGKEVLYEVDGGMLTALTPVEDV